MRLAVRARGALGLRGTRGPWANCVTVERPGPGLRVPLKCARGFSSIMDSMKSAAAQRQIAQQEKETRKMMKELSERDEFHLRHFKGYIDAGLSGWASYIPGMSQTEQFQDLERRKRVLEALTPEELDSRGTSIGRKERLRVAQSVEMAVEEVKDILHQYVCLAEMQRWLRKQKLRGRPVPSSPDEMQQEIAKRPGDYNMEAIRRIKKPTSRHRLLKEPRTKKLY